MNKKVILGLMLLVGIINMITALLILILERTSMIGVLKSLGYENKRIRRVFLIFASNILLKGILYGNIFGLSFCLLQKYTGFIRLSEADYYLSTAPIEIPVLEVIGLNGLSIAVTLVFLVLPTYMVAKVNPINVLRFN